MSFVTIEISQQITQGVESRLGNMEGRLNELFSNVDKKFQEHTGEIRGMENKIGQVGTEMLEVKAILIFECYMGGFAAG